MRSQFPALLLVLAALGCSGNSQHQSQSAAPPILTLDPVAPMLDGDTQALKATLANGEGLHLAWRAQEGLVTPTGLYTSPLTSTVDTVTVSVAEMPSVTASVKVPVRRLDVTVKPKDAGLKPQQSVRFTAAVAGGGSSDSGVRWIASGGTVDALGVYRAPAAEGVYVVRAQSLTDQRKTDDAVVTVGNPEAILVTPRDARILFGEKLQLTSTAYGMPDGTVIWSTTGGTIDQAGLYQGTEVGTWRVTATSRYNPNVSFTGSITVVTTPGGISVFVFPNPVAVEAGKQQQFTARVDGTTNGAVIWSASGGTITQDGLFTAPKATGNVTVVATSTVDPTRSASASVAIVAPASEGAIR